VGEYRLVDLLGRGGMGEMYRAIHLPSNRVVAVKMLTDHSEEIVQRFENEARLQSQLSHRNIVRVEAFFHSEGRYYLAMEYVEGHTLAERIAWRGGLEPRQAFTILRAIVAATAHLHSAGIVHRDLKPTNIRITSQLETKLLDFGVATSRCSPALTRIGNVVGTPLYLSPEQMRSGKASTHSDVWALGVLFYEMIAGHPPFEAATLPELWARVNEGHFPRLRDRREAAAAESALVRDADRLIARCLSPNPEARPAAAELLSNIDRTLAPSWFRVPTVAALWSGWQQWTTARLSTVGAAAGLALLILVLLFFARSPRPDSERAAAPSLLASSVHTIDVTQGRARVYVNGSLLGETPLDYQAQPSEVVSVELRQVGYEPARARFDVTTRRTWTFTMRALHERTPGK